jgi:hypothetical protein
MSFLTNKVYVLPFYTFHPPTCTTYATYLRRCFHVNIPLIFLFVRVSLKVVYLSRNMQGNVNYEIVQHMFVTNVQLVGINITNRITEV